MSTPPEKTMAELAVMSEEDYLAYFNAGGSMLDVMRHGTVVHFEGPAPTELREEKDLMYVTSVRLPLGMAAELSRRAGRDRDGRSGIIRAAVQEYFRNHPEPDLVDQPVQQTAQAA